MGFYFVKNKITVLHILMRTRVFGKRDFYVHFVCLYHVSRRAKNPEI